MSKPRSSRQAPSSPRLRRWARHEVFRTPRDLKLETPHATRTVVISFAIPDIDWREVLSPAEAEVAEDALSGLDNTEIALKRGAAVRTVANQLASIYRKLQVRSRLELSLYALAGRRAFGKKAQ